jgi:hypothetical protein
MNDIQRGRDFQGVAGGAGGISSQDPGGPTPEANGPPVDPAPAAPAGADERVFHLHWERGKRMLDLGTIDPDASCSPSHVFINLLGEGELAKEEVAVCVRHAGRLDAEFNLISGHAPAKKEDVYRDPECLHRVFPEESREARRKQDEKAKGPTEGEGKSSAEILMESVEGREVILDRTDNAYILLARDDCTEPLPVKSTAFRRYLVHAFEVATGKTPPTDAVRRVIDALDARVAAVGTRRCDVHVRVAGDRERVEVDLGEDSRRAVVITPAGWTIGRSSALFRRPNGVAPLLLPARGGSKDDLRPYVNLDDDEFLLFLAWLTAAMRPAGPYPVAVLIGQEGSAKSTLAKISRSLVDPSAAPLRSAPRDIRDLMVSACNNWLLNYENISSLPQWLSDAFCQLATGSGFATRTLYENDEETIFNARRPAMLNGIVEFVRHKDLIDRSIFLHPQPIDRSRRRTEEEFWDAFAEDGPDVLGALYDAVAAGMRLLPSICPDELPRMADFAKWGEAVSRGLGFDPDRFLDVYQQNIDDANENLIEASPVATAFMQFMSRLMNSQVPPPTPENKWQGTSHELLAVLTKQVGPEAAAEDAWPKTPNKLTAILRRLAGALRERGYFLNLDVRSSTERHIQAWCSDMFEMDLGGCKDAALRAQESR